MSNRVVDMLRVLIGDTLMAFPEVQQECTHVHVASVVFADGSMFKAFESCESPIAPEALIRRARRLWGELYREEPMRPEPDVYDIVRYTLDLPEVS